MESSASVAVTGAAGFVGSGVIAALRARGVRAVPIVRALDERAPPGALPIDRVLAEPELLTGHAALVHCAAIRHRHGVTARDYEAVNIHLTEALLRAGRGRIGRFCFVSSVGVYGFPARLPIDERHPYAPRTLYSATKVRAEQMLRRLGGELAVPWTIVRPTITYGPGDTHGMLDKLAAMVGAHRYLVVGRGDNVLHHTFIEDMADGIATLALAEHAAGEDFIVCGPETTTLRALSQLVAEALGTSIPRAHVPLPLARAVASAVDVLAYRGVVFDRREPPINHEKLDVMTVPIEFSGAKAARCGFVARVSYREGVRRTFESQARS